MPKPKKMKIFCIFFRKYLVMSKKVVILHAFSPRNGLMRSRVYRKKGNFEAISKGTFINKNQLNKTTKCLYLAVGCFFYVRISHIPPRAIGAHISLPAARPPRDRPSPIEPHSARSARISPAVWHISLPAPIPARISHLSTPRG